MGTRKSAGVGKKTTGSASSRVRGQRALRGRCVVRFTPGLVELGGIVSSLLNDLAGSGNRYVAEFLITEDQQRVTYIGGDASFTVIYRRGRGLLFWDERTRTVADVPAELALRTKITASPSFTSSSRTRGNTTTFVLEMRDDRLGSLRHEITVSRNEEWAPFGAGLLRILHCGPTCHTDSGLPWQALAQSGLITRERAFVADGAKPATELTVDRLEIVAVTARDFTPPAGYRRLETLVKDMSTPPAPKPRSPNEPTASQVHDELVRQALEGDRRGVPRAGEIKEDLTPDCMGSTRFGSVTATLHQDVVTLAANAVNTVVPFLGVTNIANGTWAIPWLQFLNAAGASGPGSGIRCFLRDPRRVTQPAGSSGGGLGLVDRLAFMELFKRDETTGQSRTEREFADGTLAATLARWGVGQSDTAALMASSGKLEGIRPERQRRITEAYELTELCTLSIPGLPDRVPPLPKPFFEFGSVTIGSFKSAPLFVFGLSNIAGVVNFASLAGPMITAATIGSSGNIVLGIAFPTTVISATILRALTRAGSVVIGTTATAICLVQPLLCPLVAMLLATAHFILNNATTATATATGVTWVVNIRFAFDPTTERVEPFVELAARTGTITVGTFGSTPGLLADLLDAFLASIGNALDLWGMILGAVVTGEIQKLLRSNGIQLPVAGEQTGLRAIAGGAESHLGSLLVLEADIQPVANVASQPFTTQVTTRDQMKQQQLTAHLNMRRDLNPQPATPPPGPGPVITVGTFVGLGLSQNALNYYLFAQWLAAKFEVTINDAATIASFVSAAPPQLFARLPRRIHLWPAVSPRLEMAPNEFAKGNRPLVLLFDDVRACFEASDGTTFSGMWELSCNFRTTATIDLAWPFVFSLRADQVQASSAPLEPRSWEFVDPNVPAIMNTVAPSDLVKLVDLISQETLARLAGTPLGRPINPRNWARPLPATQQLMFDPLVLTGSLGAQQLYLELLARRKAVHALMAIDTVLLQLLDGSGAPALNQLLRDLGAPGPLPTTLATMTCAQGSRLRELIPLEPGP